MMYSEWFGKSVTVEESIPVNPEVRARNQAISDFLVQQGYRDVSLTDSRIAAVRGRKIWNLINAGDPRRNYHSILVSVAPDVITARIQVDTWFGLGTKHDKGVFVSEVNILKHLLLTGEKDLAPLKEAQARRRKSDLKTLLIVGLAGVVIGLAVAAVLIFAGVWA